MGDLETQAHRSFGMSSHKRFAGKLKAHIGIHRQNMVIEKTAMGQLAGLAARYAAHALPHAPSISLTFDIAFHNL